MARYPCSNDCAPYRGPQQTMYVAVVRGIESARFKLRLCPTHFTAAQDHLAEFKVDPIDGTVAWFGSGAQCIACLEPVDEMGWQLFVTSYPTNQEREDYWAVLHGEHELPSYLNLHPDSLAPRPIRRPTTVQTVPGPNLPGNGKKRAVGP